MNSLGFSLSAEDDDESAIEQAAEFTLRSHYSRSASNGSRESYASISHTPIASPRGNQYRQTPDVSIRSLSSTSTSKKRTREIANNEFVAPPVAEKGAYRLEMSDEIDNALATLGVDRPEDRTAIQATIVQAPKDVDADSASFSRRYAMTVESMYGAGVCPICEEVMTFQHQTAKRRAASARQIASTAALNAQQRRKEAARQANMARSNLSDSDQKCHEIIYKIENELRVLVSDDRIFKLLIVLRREFVEKYLERDKIPYVPWTLALLRTHYNPANRHFYQPLRSAYHDMNMCEKQLERAFELTENDVRGFKAFKEMHECVMKARKEVNDMLNIGQSNTAEALRVLSVAIFKTTVNTNTMNLLQDPELAAGRTIAGGDNRTTAGNAGEHDPHSEYARSHISAQ